MDGYICNKRSYRDLKRLEKILEDAKSLQQRSLKEKFTTNNRTKRCVPSDSRISPSVSGPSKSLRHAMDQGRTFRFDLIISATIFARRKSAGGNMIGLSQQRKSHASSRSFGGWVRAHFPEQQLVIEPITGIDDPGFFQSQCELQTRLRMIFSLVNFCTAIYWNVITSNISAIGSVDSST